MSKTGGILVWYKACGLSSKTCAWRILGNSVEPGSGAEYLELRRCRFVLGCWRLILDLIAHMKSIPSPRSLKTTGRKFDRDLIIKGRT